MVRHLIVVDVETNGLDFDRHQAIEVAWWNLTTDERGLFIPKHDESAVLAAADIKALRVNRYVDRIADQPQAPSEDVLALWEQFAGPLFDEDDMPYPADEEPADEPKPPVAHTLVGSNPAFDVRFLSRLFVKLHDSFEISNLTPWHHRLWDVEAYAAGVLGLEEIPGLSRVCELLGVPAPDHTAEGDVTATGLCLRALMEKAGQR